MTDPAQTISPAEQDDESHDAPVPLAKRVTRAHLKSAVDNQQWDLLDLLLEHNASAIDDNALYTDTWGEWWGMLLQCCLRGYPDGVRVLLKHGAKRDAESWGDIGEPMTPKRAARDNPEILALLRSKKRPTYTRTSEPRLPKSLLNDPVNRQGEIRDRTGLVFQVEAFDSSDETETDR